MDKTRPIEVRSNIMGDIMKIRKGVVFKNEETGEAAIAELQEWIDDRAEDIGLDE